ncbi:hypothetical protein I6B53_05135 [Schaalia sp. 19OD2882]|uniref:hypothetical protein n=1 Tax=Schaalia sp. 19OD2882 TaxID=2794089 RepID=UPI001C1ED6CF|nr:hypothetical protein [Schaalia sp. 19OD2882]QWW20453.1 hypothetical protein I6B53_05135 [Schaalia sp. 19OD2882]
MCSPLARHVVGLLEGLANLHMMRVWDRRLGVAGLPAPHVATPAVLGSGCTGARMWLDGV